MSVLLLNRMSSQPNVPRISISEAELYALRTNGMRPELVHRRIIWNVLRMHLPSLASPCPTSRDRPHFWELYADTDTFDRDAEFISRFLPQNYVLPASRELDLPENTK